MYVKRGKMIIPRRWAAPPFNLFLNSIYTPVIFLVVICLSLSISSILTFRFLSIVFS